MGYIINADKFNKSVKLLSLFSDTIVFEPSEDNTYLISRFRNQGGVAFIKTVIPFDWEDDGNSPFRIVADTPHILDFIKLVDKNDNISIDYLNGWYHFKSGKVISKIREVDFSFVSDRYMKRDVKLKFPYRYTLDMKMLSKLIGVAKNSITTTFSTINDKLYGIYESSNKNQSVKLEVGNAIGDMVSEQPILVHLPKEYLAMYLKSVKGNIEVGFEGSDMPVLFKLDDGIELVVAHQVKET